MKQVFEDNPAIAVRVVENMWEYPNNMWSIYLVPRYLMEEYKLKRYLLVYGLNQQFGQTFDTLKGASRFADTHARLT